jgi:5-formyltetrahydrofolate cyclo-ligase
LSASRPQPSKGLTEQLVALVAQHGAKTVASYSPLPSEPDVTEFNSWAAGKLNLVLPRVSGHHLEFAEGKLREGAFGIAEPQGTGVSIAEIDLMIVPALAADMAGNRLGKGKGFYDRVLANYSGKRIAVIFDSELIDSVPSEPHDQQVQIIVTPLRTVVVG